MTPLGVIGVQCALSKYIAHSVLRRVDLVNWRAGLKVLRVDGTDIDPAIKEVCKRAVKRFLRHNSNARQIYDDTLQDAYVIAMSPRGKKEPKNDKQLFGKIYYGLIDLHRHRTHSRWYQRTKTERPLVFSIERSDISLDFRDSISSYQRWYKEEREKRTREDVVDFIERATKSFCKRDRQWVCEYFLEGKTLAEIAKENNMSETRISQVVGLFKEMARKQYGRYL